MFSLGIEQLIKNKKLLGELKSRRVALVGHPASVDQKLRHTSDVLMAAKVPLSCAFGPQHGLRGEKQDNMIESQDFKDPKYGFPIFSLYGEVRRPTPEMLKHFDVVLYDLQDLGCRIYTFLTTLFYMLEDCARTGKAVWVLDRPLTAGRPVEGSYLLKDHFTFVGGAEIVMRHGLTLGEAGTWYIQKCNLDVDYKVIKMQGYNPNKKGEWGWPAGTLSWTNPSPNIPNVHGARMYAGTVLIEGTKISEGRGTTRPLELFGHPSIDGEKVVKEIQRLIPKYLKNVTLRPCFFEPTFQKHKGQLCSGFQIHIDQKNYQHNTFKPYRIVCAAFKAVRNLYPDFDLWIPPPYEYEKIKMPIDILSGSSFLREWVDDRASKWSDLETYLSKDEKSWTKESKKFHIY